MLSHPFDFNPNHTSQRRRYQAKILPFLGSLMFRLPVLIVWTLVVIYVLYRFADNSSESLPSAITTNDPNVFGSSLDLDQILQAKLLAAGDNRQDAIQSTTSGDVDDNAVQVDDYNGQESAEESVTKFPGGKIVAEDLASSQRTGSKNRRLSEDYVRQSSVFILIVQSSVPNFKKRVKFTSKTNHKHIESSNGRPLDAETYLNSDTSNNRRAQLLPSHIELLIDILRSHRISFTLDSVSERDGLPAALLNSQKRQYSVLVIDDFVSYTKMNRWQRDQLDRFCRTQQIGVITYLTSRSIDLSQSINLSQLVSSSSTSSGTALFRRDVILDDNEPAKSVRLTDQFPLAFKPLHSDGSCRNLSAGSTCLVDYQVNERIEFLRILKRGEPILLSGPVDKFSFSDDPTKSAHQRQRVSLSSSHITYEPILWAKEIRSAANNKQVKRDATLSSATKETSAQADAADVAKVPNGLAQNTLHSRDHTDLAVYPPPTSSSSSRPMTSKVTAQSLSSSSSLAAHSNEANNKRFTGSGFASTGMQLDSLLSSSSGGGSRSSAAEQPTSSIELMSVLGSNNSNNNNNNNNIGSMDAAGRVHDDMEQRVVLSMLDRGLYDGIKRVIFGSANEHWADRILLLDAIEHLSGGSILSPLDRYVQIDIDDVFVGERGKRMHRSDVDALIETQNRFAELIGTSTSQPVGERFRFNLGYSGRFFKRGSSEENLGDERLVERATEFNWFCHFWAHTKAHLFNGSASLADELRKNLRFARQHNLPVQSALKTGNRPRAASYAVAPHHSGVYPIHEPLYEAWRQVLNVKVTSTEEYPHLRPASARRAFVHRQIQVLPRQTCGLYTHTIWRQHYPGGFGRLQASIYGGELFETVLHNPVNIYMTHMSNYANDRLALYTFSELIGFVQKYTNLQLRYANPTQIGDIYFDLFPAEQTTPSWTNPCDDKRHLAIWSDSKRYLCNHVPRILIVGPQKTGTTALYTFLKLNPLFESARMSREDFEEVQFFNDKHYGRGSDWYLSRFESANANPIEPIYFDKSATYFDDPKVPARASNLLPNARIIMLLVDPADRAYSWYQHMKAHGDIIANGLSFDQLILDTRDDIGATENRTTTKIELNPKNLLEDASSIAAIRQLRNRCIQPGFYAQHLINWLEHYSSRQIIIIDGQWFKYNPAAVMNRLQLLLGVQNPMDYNEVLAFDSRKGYFCPLDTQAKNRTRCLGKSKGRKYEPMGERVRHYLNRLYLNQNRQLANLLNDIGQPLPTWLDAALDSVAQLASASDRSL